MKKRLLLLLIVVLPILFVAFSFLGLLKFIGVTYDSNWSLFAFMLVLWVIEILLKTILGVFQPIPENFFFEFLKNCFSLSLTSIFFSSVTIHFITIIALALILASVEAMIDALEDE